MSKHGYSLVELMMVIGIIGVVGASAVPSLVGRQPHREMKTAAWQIYMDLQQAKATAVSQDVSVTVIVDNTRDQYTIWADSDRDGIKDFGETEIKDLLDAPSVDLFSSPTTMSFSSSGTASSSSYYFYMRVSSSYAGTQYIYVFPNGHIDPYRIQYGG